MMNIRDSIAAALEDQKRKTAIEYDMRGKRQSKNIEDRRFPQQQKKPGKWKPGDGGWPTPTPFPSGPFQGGPPKQKAPPPFTPKSQFPEAQVDVQQKNPFPPGEGPPRRQIWRDEKRARR